MSGGDLISESLTPPQSLRNCCLPVFVAAASGQIKYQKIAEIHGKYITPDDALESVEETTLSSCRDPSHLVDNLHVQCSCRQNGIWFFFDTESIMHCWPKLMSSPEPKDKFLVYYGDAYTGLISLQTQILSQHDCMENSFGQKNIYWHRSYSKSRRNNKTLRSS